MPNNIIDKIRVSGTDYTLSATTSGVSVVEVTQAEYDALPSSAKTDTSKMYVITDAEAGDLTNYYTKTETNTLLGNKADTATTYTKTETDNAITAATATKQDTLVSSVNIKTINNESLLGSGNIDIQGGGSGVSVVEVTQAEYDELPSSAKTDTSKMYVITDAQAGDLSQYWTSAQTNSAITEATSGKVDSSSVVTAVTSASTDNEIPTAKAVFDAIPTGGTGGGKAIEAGRGISITTGETADTVSFNLPISAGTGSNSLVLNAAPSSIRKAVGKYSFVGGGGSSNAEGESSFIFGNACRTKGANSISLGQFLYSNNFVETSLGRYNNSVSGSSTFGNSGNTLFSVGNGTSNSARHNAFEIRQNGDIYISSGGTDIKLQDHLGGGGSSYSAGTGIDITNDVISVTGMVATSAVTSAVTSGDTNPVQGGALWDELRIENAPVETTLTFRQPIGEDDYWTTNYPSGCTTLVGNILRSSTQIELYNNSSDLGGFMINCYDGVLDSVTFWGIEGTYSISGSVVTISYPNVTNVTRFRIREQEYQPDYQTYKAMATVAPTVLKNQVNDNTTALGGLKLVKISQSDYENLQNKDNDTLYVILGS